MTLTHGNRLYCGPSKSDSGLCHFLNEIITPEIRTICLDAAKNTKKKNDSGATYIEIVY